MPSLCLSYWCPLSGTTCHVYILESGCQCRHRAQAHKASETSKLRVYFNGAPQNLINLLRTMIAMWWALGQECHLDCYTLTTNMVKRKLGSEMPVFFTLLFMYILTEKYFLKIQFPQILVSGHDPKAWEMPALTISRGQCDT